MVETDLNQIWKKVLETIFSSLDPQTQELWISPIVPKELKGNILILNAPNKYFEDWIISGGYKTKIEEIVSKEINCDIEIKFDYQYDLKSIQQENGIDQKNRF